MNTCRCISQSASLTTTHRVYLAKSSQETHKFDATGRELAAGAKTRDKRYGAEKAFSGSQTS